MSFYMHKNAMDCCIQVGSVRHRDPSQLVVAFRFFNLGYSGKPWPLSGYLVQEFDSSDFLMNWVNISDKVNLKRTKPGVP